MAVSCRLRCCAVTAAAAEGDFRLPNPRLARSEKSRIKRRPIALPRRQGSGESAPWWRHTRVLARGHAAQGESRCVSQTGSYVTRVTGIARPVSGTVRWHHKSRYFPYTQWRRSPRSRISTHPRRINIVYGAALVSFRTAIYIRGLGLALRAHLDLGPAAIWSSIRSGSSGAPLSRPRRAQRMRSARR